MVARDGRTGGKLEKGTKSIVLWKRVPEWKQWKMQPGSHCEEI